MEKRVQIGEGARSYATILYLFTTLPADFLITFDCLCQFLVISLVIGGVHLYEKREHRSRLATHADDVGVSVIVPAYNEALTIVNTDDC